MESGVVFYSTHMLAHGGVRALLQAEPDLHLRATAHTAQATEQALVEHRPHLLLLELTEPLRGAVVWVQRLHVVHPEVHVLVLGQWVAPVVQQLWAAGVRAVLDRHAPEQEVVQALRVVAHGGVHANAWLPHQALRRGQRREAPVAQRLTPRELQLLHLLCAPHGHTLEQIAQRLGVGLTTVQYHRNNLYTKLGVHDRVSLMHAAHAARLIGG